MKDNKPLSPEKLAAEQSALVPYVPRSKATVKLDTLIPKNMAFEVRQALGKVSRQFGNLDNFVMTHLKYSSTAQLWKALAAEQVDAVALYLAQFERSQGIIIADQTGIGKGRQAAAIIRHSIYNGYIPVFFTRKPDLFSDMYRDLKNIAFDDCKPFIVNTDTDAKIKDAEGNVVTTPLTAKTQYNLLCQEVEVATDSKEAIAYYQSIGKFLPDPQTTPTTTLVKTIDFLPEAYNAVFCTYSQIQQAHPYKRLWLRQLTNRGVVGSVKHKPVVFILDESHMAGGFDSIIGTWMREVLPKAKSCCYLSATFAKYPEVMPFYAKKTAIQETGMKDAAFVGAMERGGLALQEIVAANLCESGQLVRRQRSNEGITVEYIVLDKEPERTKNRERVNRIIRLMNQVVEFEQEYIVPIISDIHAKAKEEGEKVENKPRSLGVKQSPYFSKVFNIIDQLLFSLKVEEVARYALEKLSEDKKVVIAFKSTMGAFLKDLNLSTGDAIHKEQLDFARTLLRGLDSLFYYNYTSIGGSKTREKIPLTDLPEDGVKRYEEIQQDMKAETSGLNISPIDQLIALIEGSKKPKALGGHKGTHFRVAEVTGRKQRIRFEEGQVLVESFRSDAEKSFRLFNSGEMDVLLINQSGSTGSSAHASEEFSDQRVRAMYIHQFELDINTEVQKRGRINRTGQVVLPEYYYITSDIPAERRLMTMLKAKLKSLDANTTGSQKTSEDTLKSPDFLNKYGDIVAWQWVDENPELSRRMGHPTYSRKVDKTGTAFYARNESKEGAIKQVTGRAGLLSVEEQDELYNDLLERYEHHINWEKQRGTYDLETEFLKLDAERKKRFLFQKGTGGTTPFGTDTVREVSIINNLKRPFTKDELDALIDTNLEGKKPKQVQVELLTQIKTNYPNLIEERKTKREQALSKLKEELAALPPQGSKKSEEENEKLEKKRSKLQELVTSKQNSLAEYVRELENVQQQLIKAINYWEIGDVVKVPLPGTLSSSWGVFIGVGFGNAKNPYTLGNVTLKFAVSDARKLVEYNLTAEQRSEISTIYTESEDIQDEQRKKVQVQWNELVKEASAKREKRHILTKNIVASAGEIGMHNKLIKFNTTDGEIKNGILLSRDYGKEGEDRKALLPLSHAFTDLKDLAPESTFRDHQNRIRFKKNLTNSTNGVAREQFTVYITKSGNFQLHTDEKLRSLLERAAGQSKDELPDFVQNAGDMTGTLSLKNTEEFLHILDKQGLQYYGEAKELEEWEVENEQEWKKQNDGTGERHRYKLNRPYGQGSNPSSGFIEYEQPDAHHPYGVVIYKRRLTDKERYNYSLLPLFADVTEPFTAWKRFMEASPKHHKSYKQLLASVKDTAAHNAIAVLGTFIFDNPHEDGNLEFVFGEFSREAIGKVAYEETFGRLAAIDELLLQLKMEVRNTN